jgi:hypothetical protein
MAARLDFSDGVLRQRMHQWIDTNEVDLSLNVPEFVMRAYLTGCPSPTKDKEIIELKRRVAELERISGGVRVPDEVDQVYNKFKVELEKQNLGKIVAIDLDSKTIAGIGSSVSEAYDQAKAKTGKEQFDFRRVGFKYLRTV